MMVSNVGEIIKQEKSRNKIKKDDLGIMFKLFKDKYKY